MANPSSSDPSVAGPPDPQHAARLFAELGKILHASADTFSLHRVLLQVAQAAQQVLPELDDVSVTLLEGKEARTVVFTGALASVLDERQYELGFGPCMDAALSGTTVTVDTAEPDSVYPDFARIAAGHGVTQVLSVGLPVPQRTVGALNMYSKAEQQISAESRMLAEAFAGYAGVAVANAHLYQSAVDEAHHMHEAMKNRAVIEQAKGILMTTRRCTADQAFAMLTRASQNQNRKLHDIATDLVRRTQPRN